MPLVIKDRVKETTTTTGTGTYTLAGASAGYQSFSVVGNGNTTYYTVANGTDWEVGIGTYTAAGTTLSRNTILESSNAGSAVNWGAGSKDVFVTYPAERAVYVDGSSIVPATSASLPSTSGGTGQTSYTEGDLLYASSSTTLSKLGVGAPGEVLQAGATTPEYGGLSGNNTTIQIANSSVPGSVPTAVSLSAGELVINTADGKLYFKDSGGTVKFFSQANPIYLANYFGGF